MNSWCGTGGNNGHTFSDDHIQVSLGVIFSCSEQTRHSLVARLPRFKSGCRSQTMYFDYVFQVNIIIMDIVIIVSELHTDVN